MREIEVEREGGGTWQWPLCQPNLLFSTLVAESAQLQQVIEEALRTSPGTRDRPWHLIVGFDEFVPGNKLQLQPNRKAMNVSFTFLELGSDGVGEVGSIGAGFFASIFPRAVSNSSNMAGCPKLLLSVSKMFQRVPKGSGRLRKVPKSF